MDFEVDVSPLRQGNFCEEEKDSGSGAAALLPAGWHASLASGLVILAAARG